MAPARSSTRRAHVEQNIIPPSSLHDQDTDDNAAEQLFIDPMLGTPLAIYIEKDVDDRDSLVELINVRHVASDVCNIYVQENLQRSYSVSPFYRWYHDLSTGYSRFPF